MEIKNGTSVLVMRFNNYGKYDFINEHKKLIEAHGYTWMFKVGRPIQGPKMSAVMEQGGWLILKAPKSSGSSFYLSRIHSCRTGKKPDDNVFPSYYHMMVDDDRLWNVDSLYGSWLKIVSISPLSETALTHLRLKSNGKLVSDVLDSCMTPILYAEPDIDMTL